MSSETNNHRLQEIQISGEEAEKRAVQAMQRDIIKFGILILQPDGQTVFPRVPQGGAMLITPKGMYEGIFTDAATPVPQWRRLTGGTIFAVGATIPTTL